MYVAKRAGRNRYCYFTPAAQQAAEQNQQTLDELRAAVSKGELRLYYQPIFELSSGRICKAEALMRWQHPRRGILSPAEFIPFAEELGLIHEIGAWLLLESSRQIKQWQSHCNKGFQISVNLSSIQLQSSSHCKDWLNALQTTGVSGNHMLFEINPRALHEADSHVATQLRTCREAGIQLAVDGFGSGHSALAHLKAFDIDYLKITPSFVRNIAADSSELALSASVIQAAHELDIKVIAQGVETTAQRDLLIAAGCDYVQGYLYSRAVPPAEFERLLKANPPRA